jgi:hypothetical protein
MGGGTEEAGAGGCDGFFGAERSKYSLFGEGSTPLSPSKQSEERNGSGLLSSTL